MRQHKKLWETRTSVEMLTLIMKANWQYMYIIYILYKHCNVGASLNINILLAVHQTSLFFETPKNSKTQSVCWRLWAYWLRSSRLNLCVRCNQRTCDLAKLTWTWGHSSLMDWNRKITYSCCELLPVTKSYLVIIPYNDVSLWGRMTCIEGRVPAFKWNVALSPND